MFKERHFGLHLLPLFLYSPNQLIAYFAHSYKNIRLRLQYPGRLYMFFLKRGFFYSEYSKVSINLVVKLPARKFGSCNNFKWKGMVVFTPSITNSLSARSMVLR